MSTVTLKAIETQHDKLAEMIADFKAANESSYINIKAASIELKSGEHYAGIILGEDGQPKQHLVLLADELKETNYPDAIKWAAEMKVELPTRQEQALLYANLKAQFESEWYWSSAQYAGNSDYAWCQDFGNGTQGNDDEGLKLRARAVRRLTIQ